jgi:hypothetical protein
LQCAAPVSRARHIFARRAIHSSQHEPLELFLERRGADEESAMQSVKGMVQVSGRTFRIVRITRGHYEVIRILDDARIGAFRSTPTLSVCEGEHRDLVREIARCAIQGGKTSWVGRLATTP